MKLSTGKQIKSVFIEMRLLVNTNGNQFSPRTLYASPGSISKESKDTTRTILVKMSKKNPRSFLTYSHVPLSGCLTQFVLKDQLVCMEGRGHSNIVSKKQSPVSSKRKY